MPRLAFNPAQLELNFPRMVTEQRPAWEVRIPPPPMIEGADPSRRPGTVRWQHFGHTTPKPDVKAMQAPKPEPDFISIRAAAERLGCTTAYVYVLSKKEAWATKMNTSSGRRAGEPLKLVSLADVKAHLRKSTAHTG